jgi:transposase InsO family protein
VSSLLPEDVRQFIVDQLQTLGTTSNAITIASTLRAYLRYRATCGDAVQPLLAVIARPAHWSMASLPRGLKPEEVDRLLNSFTDALPSPRRGHAVVRLALDLGLRGIEINRLQLADIDWRVGTVKRHPSKDAGLIFRSDRGSQYASRDFTDVLKEYGITPSMSRRGNCWDNACSETLFGSLKVERLYGQRFRTRRHARDRTISWLFWYDRSRLHSTLAYVSPMQFEQDRLANQPRQANS